MNILSPEEIIEQVKIVTGDRFDSDLARRLNIDKQSFPQYKNKKTVDLQQKIISLLLSELYDKHETHNKKIQRTV
jgi:hypothetical protein